MLFNLYFPLNSHRVVTPSPFFMFTVTVHTIIGDNNKLLPYSLYLLVHHSSFHVISPQIKQVLFTFSSSDTLCRQGRTPLLSYLDAMHHGKSLQIFRRKWRHESVLTSRYSYVSSVSWTCRKGINSEVKNTRVQSCLSWAPLSNT